MWYEKTIKFLQSLPTWAYWVAGTGLVVIQLGTLYAFGQPVISESGRILLWVGNPLSSETSQQISDWYSLSHIIHGFIFYWIFTLLVPRAPLGARLIAAVGLEVGWEILENSTVVIEAYRQQALAAGYTGDSMLNSFSDTCMVIGGFLLASRLPAKAIIAIAIAFELLAGFMIRDNLTLNVLNFIVPSQAIHDWQSGG